MDAMQHEAAPEAIARAAHRLGCRSVAFTYNDPVIFHEYAVDIAAACRDADIKTVAVTAGYLTDRSRESFFQGIDAANVDLKAFTEDFYWSITKSELRPVLDTLLYLKHETSVWFEITNLIIPDENDAETEIEEMTQWVVENLGPDVPMHFSAFIRITGCSTSPGHRSTRWPWPAASRVRTGCGTPTPAMSTTSVASPPIAMSAESGRSAGIGTSFPTEPGRRRQLPQLRHPGGGCV